jgi:hypothetical protein
VKLAGQMILMVACSAVPATAQEPRAVRLGPPVAESVRGFTSVSGVREIPGGVVLVDSDERYIYILDERLASARVAGRHGQGPGEYLAPRRIFALRADTSAVFDDMGGGSMVIISPDGRPADSRSRRIGAGEANLPRVASAIDRQGTFYTEGLPVRAAADGRSTLVDSAAIERWRDGAVDTVAHIPVPLDGVQFRGGLGVSRLPRAPFSSAPQWTVSADGIVALVHLEPYRVVLMRPDGRRVEGPPIAYQPVRVTEDQREAWRTQQRRPRPMLSSRVGPDGPGRGQVRMMTLPSREPENWPRTLPPFPASAAKFAPDGSLWVQRNTPANAPPEYDVFNHEARRFRRVLLPPATRLIGFGAGSVYVVRKDEFDLEYLQRLPYR